MVGQPGGLAPLVHGRFAEEFGWPDPDCVRPAIGIGTDRPSIQTPAAANNEALTVGVKQDATASVSIECGDLPTRFGLP